MNYLIDTHVFLWWTGDKSRLSTRVMTTMLNPSHTLALSVASIWELAIKLQIGKLRLNGDLSTLSTLITREVRTNQFQILPVATQHALKTMALPPHHRDPFDRMLIAQALSENMTLISADDLIGQYDVKRLW